MGKYVTVNTSGARLAVRKGPSIIYPLFSTNSWLPDKTKIHVGPTSKEWYKIDQGTYSGGWVHSKYCKDVATQRRATRPNTVSSNKSSTVANDSLIATNTKSKIDEILNNKNAKLTKKISQYSTRLFGIPHQLTSHNDSRISKTSRLGRMFAETFILDAPTIYLKPGISNFLPGMSKQEKEAYTAAFTSLAGDSDTNKSLLDQLKTMMGQGDDLRYFTFKQSYATYIANVNLLCRISAVFLGIDEMKVPWVTGGDVTYGSYDWRYYTIDDQETPKTMTQTNDAKKSKSLGAFVKNAVNSLDTALMDDRYVRYYVDANTSFSESASNSTTQSMINQFTDQISSMGKELEFVSGFSGADISGVTDSVAGGADSIIKSIATGDGAIATALKRLTGTSSQLLAGSNFLAPDVWGDSDYSKSYSFSMNLTTPYGTKESWFLNILVPLMHLLAMALPVQTSSNTYSAPFLVKAFCPGWFSCDLGIIDSISIEKGGSGDAWSSSGLPNEIKVQVSIKDLYSNLALPDGYSITKFFNNDGLINFLMVNCGVDIRKTGLDDKINIITNLFTNSISDFVTEGVSNIWYQLQDDLRGITSLYR